MANKPTGWDYLDYLNNESNGKGGPRNRGNSGGGAKKSGGGIVIVILIVVIVAFLKLRGAF